MHDIKLHKAPQRWPMVLISLDKFVKAAGLIIASFVLAPHWHQAALDWVSDAQLTPHNRLVTGILHSLSTALGIQAKSLHVVRVFVVIYAVLYLIEGVGLYYEKKWAEWMVVIGVALFLPLEIYDFIREPRWTMVIIFLLNLLMAIYLLWRIHRQAVIKRERAALDQAAGHTA